MVQQVQLRPDPYGYLSLCIRYASPICLLESSEHSLDKLIVNHSISLLEASTAIERVVIEKRISDDQVAVEPLAYDRATILEWYAGKFDIDSLSSHSIHYWYTDKAARTSNLLIDAFVVCFSHNSIVGIKRGDGWHLPGGKTSAADLHFALKNFVLEQTGLTLWGLGPGLPLTQAGLEQKTVLYFGLVRGELKSGSWVPLDKLDMFPRDYGNLRAFVDWQTRDLHLRDA